MTSASMPDQSVQRSVALLRGINVGGNNRLSMKALESMFASERCSEVKTYIQSGNVIFTARLGALDHIADRVSARIHQEFGFRPPIVFRSEAELQSCVAANPFAVPAAAEKDLHVMFLREVPSVQSVATLDPLRSDPDAFVVQGRDVYLNVPRGLGTTKLTNQYFDSKLGTVSTVRNWNTVRKLLAVLRG